MYICLHALHPVDLLPLGTCWFIVGYQCLDAYIYIYISIYIYIYICIFMYIYIFVFFVVIYPYIIYMDRYIYKIYIYIICMVLVETRKYRQVDLRCLFPQIKN